MATSRISSNVGLSSSKNERRQVEARIRALQQRTNALNEELSRSSTVADSAVNDIERTYMTIINEFHDQRDQLLRQVHHAKQNIRQSTNELNGIRKHLQKTQAFHAPKSSPRYSSDFEAQEMNAMVDDIERVLNNIAQQLKQYRFKPTQNRAMSKSLGTIQSGKTVKQKELSIISAPKKQANPLENISVYKLYTIDIDISPQWVIANIIDRIFLCNNEGEVRTYSCSNRFRRQPLLTEQFRLTTVRLITAFAVTQDYLIAFETDTQMLTLHNHHGALMVRMRFPYDPLMIIHGDYSRRNLIWTCSRSKRQCYQFAMNHNEKELNPLELLDFKHPISNILIDPVGISIDEDERIAVHDVNQSTSDRLLIFDHHHNRIIPLNFIKYADRQMTSRIERVLLVPRQPNLIVLVYAPQSTSTHLHEIIIVDISVQPAQILHRLTEQYGIRNLDLTLTGELIYSVTPPANKRIVPKLHIYRLFN